MDDSGKLMDLDSSKKHSKKNNRFQQSVQTANPRQTANSKRMMNSKQIAKLVRTAKPKCSAKFKQATRPEQTVKLGQTDQLALSEQIVRITEMEALFVQCEEAVRQLSQAQENKASITPDLAVLSDLKDLTSALATLRSAIPILEAYYTSPAWRTDFEADEAGLLPPDLKRGVLSEDGIYNLLEEYKRVEGEMIGEK